MEKTKQINEELSTNQKIRMDELQAIHSLIIQTATTSPLNAVFKTRHKCLLHLFNHFQAKDASFKPSTLKSFCTQMKFNSQYLAAEEQKITKTLLTLKIYSISFEVHCYIGILSYIATTSCC